MDKVIRLSFNYSIPDLLAGKVQVSRPYQNYNARGNPTSFGIDLDFPEMELSKTSKSSEFSLLRGKIEETLRSWEKKYQKHLDKERKGRRAASVDDTNDHIDVVGLALDAILAHALDGDHSLDWDAVKRKDDFRIKPDKLFDAGRKPDFINFNPYGRPTSFKTVDPPVKPTIGGVKEGYGFFGRLLRGKAISSDFQQRLGDWQRQVEETEKKNAVRETRFREAQAKFQAMKEAFEQEKRREHAALEDIKLRYKDGDPKAVEEYCDLVLSSSDYPDYFPKNWVLEYRPDNRMVVVAYHLPSPDKLPTVKSYSYVKARDQITEQQISVAERKRMYEGVIYQVCIRTIHELIEADQISAIEAVAFNGLVTHTNPATGIKETKVILSVLADKSQFGKFDLSHVHPKATFKHLRGVAAATLIDLTPIPPVIQLDKADKRFIEGRMVAGDLDESVNIAAMDWADFEHLIRELFEKEFSANGGEVKVTQASADGGVDAVAFDPDPIRGGKIVIQAKRYTNVVGVAAVRDLEGYDRTAVAPKGILVTTSNYGKDSYEFAKGKPITLLNGSNLLALLEKHGHKARINVAEAKTILNK